MKRFGSVVVMPDVCPKLLQNGVSRHREKKNGFTGNMSFTPRA
jgi:hypothetical protein